MNLIDSLSSKKVTNVFDQISDEPRGSIANKIISNREYFYENPRFRFNEPSGKWYIYERPKGIHTYRYSDETMNKDIKAFKVEIYDDQDMMLKSIDLEKTNPYANKENPKYLGEGRPGFQERAFAKLATETKNDLLKICHEYYSIAEVWESSEDYVIIDYGMVARDKNQRYIGEEHTWIILNNKGIELGKIDDLFGWVRDGVLSKDKSLLFFLMGDIRSLKKQKLQILNLRKNEMIYDSNHLKESYSVLREVKFEGGDQQWISIGVENLLNDNIISIEKYINVNTQTILTKSFNKREWEEVEAYYGENKNATAQWMIDEFDFLTEKF